MTFTMRYPFQTIHIVLLCEGRIIKDSIKLQIISGVCIMVGERDFKFVICCLATLVSRSKLLLELTSDIISFPW